MISENFISSAYFATPLLFRAQIFQDIIHSDFFLLIRIKVSTDLRIPYPWSPSPQIFSFCNINMTYSLMEKTAQILYIAFSLNWLLALVQPCWNRSRGGPQRCSEGISPMKNGLVSCVCSAWRKEGSGEDLTTSFQYLQRTYRKAGEELHQGV